MMFHLRRRLGLSIAFATLFGTACLSHVHGQNEPSSSTDSNPTADDLFRPVVFSKSNERSVTFDGPMLGSVGTIELVLAADEGTETDLPSALLTHGSGSHLGFALLTDASRKRIGLTNGRRTEWVNADLSDGDFHHLAVVTTKDLSEVYLDDKYLGYLKAGYGPVADLAFQLGGKVEGRSPFVGQIATLRLWNTALSSDELAAMKFYGAPPESHPRHSDLLAASHFTTQAAEVVIYSPPVGASDFLGLKEGPQDEQIAPVGASIQEVAIRWQNLPNASDGSNQTRIVDVAPRFRTRDDATVQSLDAVAAKRRAADAATYSAACRRALLFDFERMFHKVDEELKQGWAAYLQVKDTMALVETWDPKRRNDVLHTLDRYSLEIFELNEGQKRLLGSPDFRAVERSLARWFHDCDSATDSSAATTPNSVPFDGNTTTIKLEKDEVFVGAAVTYGTYLQSLRFITNRRLLEVCGTATGPNVADVQIPFTGRLAGFTSIRDDLGLLGLALAYRVPPGELVAAGAWSNQHPLIPPATSLGRFTPENAPEIVRDDDTVRRLALKGDPGAQALIDSRDGNIQIHGNYTSYPVYKLWLTVDGHLILAIDNPSNPLTGRVEHASELFTPVTGRIDAFLSSSSTPANPSRELKLLEDGTFVLGGIRYAPPAPYDNSGDERDKIAWGGTFSTEQRPTMSEFNVKGYDVEKLDPRNYQLSTGTPNRVFAWPADGDIDYQTTTNGKIIPNGLIYRNDRQAMERARSHYAATQEEHTRAWNVNLGFQIGIPGLLSFGLDGSYQHEKDDMSRSGSGRTISMAQEVKYALVLDRSRVALDEGFRRRVLRMRAEKLAGKRPDYAALIDSFGTNYPYAVTYGGTAFQEKNFTEAESMTTTSQGFDLSQQSSATLEGVTVGRTIGGGSSSSDTSGSSAKDEDDGVQTIGGELSKGGGWSLPDRSEVPVLLDLRPLDELFSPLFFADPIVWNEMRKEVHDYLVERANSRTRTLDPDNFGPRYFELRLDAVENNTSGDLTLPSTLGVFSTLFNVTAWRKKSRSSGGTVDLVDLQVQGRKYSGKDGDQAPLGLFTSTGFNLANQEYQDLSDNFDSVTADGDTPRFITQSCIIQYRPHQFSNGGEIWLVLPDGFPWIVRNVIPQSVGQYSATRAVIADTKTMVTLPISPANLAGQGEIVFGTPDGRSMMSVYYSFREMSLDREVLFPDK